MKMGWIGINIRQAIGAARRVFLDRVGLCRPLDRASSGYEQGLVMGTRLESLPFGNHVVAKSRVDRSLLSETPV